MGEEAALQLTQLRRCSFSRDKFFKNDISLFYLSNK